MPILLPDQLDIPASFDDVAKAGSMLGSAGIIVMDETTCMVWAARNLLYFYKHESCGKCTPCREGGDWLLQDPDADRERRRRDARHRSARRASANNIAGKTLCAFGDAAATPALTTVKHFRAEFEAHVREGRCTRAGRLARGDGCRWGRTDDELPAVADDHRAARADLRRLQHAGAVGRLHGVDGAEGLRLHPGPQRPEPGRLRGRRCSRSPTSSSCSSRSSCGRRRPTRSSSRSRRWSRRPRRSRRSRSCRSAPRRRSSGCSISRSRCRSPTSTSPCWSIFAITSMGIYGIVLAGWSSNSKYSLLGGLRSSAQMISYELSYGLALAAVIMMAGSLSLREIVMQPVRRRGSASSRAGTSSCSRFGFLIYLTAGVAETNRAPFDFPEAEQELVAGYHTEYSSMSFAMFFLAEYVNMVTVSAVATSLYLGGWLGPFLPDWLGVDLVPGQGVPDPVLLRLDAVDAAALPLRPADGVRLEVAVAGGGGEPVRHGGDGSLDRMTCDVPRANVQRQPGSTDGALVARST